MLSVVDSDEHIRMFMPVLEKMIANGLAVISDVDVITYRYGAASEAVARGSHGEADL